MYAIASVAILAQALKSPCVFSAAMQNVQEAMQLLELHDGFSAGQLTKQFHRMSLHCHPDKPGGSTAKMQRVLDARDLCDAFLNRSPGPILRPEPPETRPGNAQTPPASAPPIGR